ncbi:carboxypeptidase-like regulatory domain-containing protein [Gaetbulibacter sp. M240]|uniref:carboxypeptidase-like regulatory domain-containing protein n=1 Tax=Gaetbulibacter sp. M240 TaxID=3126511 RepID=UPI00374F2157
MKLFYTVVFLVITATGFAQNTGRISGNLLDLESNKAPLNMAKVTLKGLNTETVSDAQGHFKFDNLKPGTYTLVSRFVGYDPKEITVEVKPETTNTVTLEMAASSISLEDLVSLASAGQKTASVSDN